MSEDFETTYARHKELCATVNELNKAVLFEALAPAGITAINVEFDGEGDSGQINGVSAHIGDQPTPLPPTMITIREISWGETEATSSELTLEAAVESLCYDYLEQEHGGWENNGGGYGEFHISVTERTTSLSFTLDSPTSKNTVIAFSGRSWHIRIITRSPASGSGAAASKTINASTAGSTNRR